MAEVQVRGQNKVNEAFIQAQFAGAAEASGVGELQEIALRGLGNLFQTGLFANANSNILRTKEGLLIDVEVLEKTKMDRVSVETKLDSKSREVSLSTSYSHPNVFGSAEHLSIESSMGSRDGKSLQLRMGKQTVIAERPLSLDLFAGASVQNRTTSQSYLAKVRELGFTASSGSHSLGYSLSWRDVAPKGATLWDAARQEYYVRAPSAGIVGASAPSLKGSLRYAYSHSNLDSPAVPTDGRSVKASAELAGLLGDVRFFKTEGSAKLFRDFGPFSAGISVATGYVLPLDKGLGAQSIPVLDRFCYGGDTSVRGFRAESLSPRDGADSLGGNLFAGVAASLSCPFPHANLAAAGVRLHGWLNAGNCINTSAGPVPAQLVGVASPTAGQQQHAAAADALATAGRNLKQMVTGGRLSVGMGLVIPFGPVRVELNLCKPLVFRGEDDRDGFQLGLGLSDWL